MKFLILLFSFSAFAATHHGTFTAVEVEPILVWEYVSATCTRSESESCNCSDEGCQTCSVNVAYECGGDEWVRKGSKPLYELEVEYDINSSLQPIISGTKEIDKDFTAESMLSTFFVRPDSQNLIYAQNVTAKIITLSESSVGPGKKRIKFSADWSVIDTNKVNETFKQTIIVNESELHFDEKLIKQPLILNVCVGQDRRLSRTVKHIGCQDITAEEFKSGMVILKEINFAAANRNRNLVYFFNWRVNGTWLAGYRGPGPFVVVERR